MVSVYSLWKTDNFTGQEDIESEYKKWIENSLLLLLIEKEELAEFFERRMLIDRRSIR